MSAETTAEQWAEVAMRWPQKTPEEWAAHDAKVRAEREAEEKQRAAEKFAVLLREAAMPARAVACASGDPVETEALRAIATPGSPLVLAGEPGTGKTVAAVSWLLRGIKDGVKGRFVTAAAVSRVSRYDAAVMTSLFTVPRLVVDDLGMEFLDVKGALESLLDELLNERYGATLPTVITTNLTDEAFKARYSPRVVDRIREAGRFVWLAGESMRRRP